MKQRIEKKIFKKIPKKKEVKARVRNEGKGVTCQNAFSR